MNIFSIGVREEEYLLTFPYVYPFIDSGGCLPLQLGLRPSCCLAALLHQTVRSHNLQAFVTSTS